MTGICGWIGSALDPKPARQLLDSMSEHLSDGKGDSRSLVIPDPCTGMANVHPTAAGGIHREGDCIVCYEGYPRSSLPKFDALAQQKGLAYAICATYQERGRELLEHLSGPFSLAIMEPLRKRALLAVDRLGIRPLAYAQVDGALIYASRLDAILPYPGIDRTLNLQSLFNYLYFHVVPSPDCIYAGMKKIQPGEYIAYDGGTLERRFYWTLRYEEDFETGEHALSEELRERLRVAVQRCASDRPTGVFLSGGLDSTSVTGVFSGLSEKPVDAYAIGFDVEGYDEMPYARASAAHYRARLHEHYVVPEDIENLIPLIASAYDEPFGNASAVPAYCCARAAHGDGIRVLLAGDGGDEIFAGNARYAKQKVFELYSLLPERLRHSLIEPVMNGTSATSRIPPWRKLRSYVEQAKIPLPERLESYNFLNRTSLENVLQPDFLAAIDPGAPLSNIRRVYERTDSDSMLKRMLYLDLKLTLADNDLRKVNRMGELAGIEVRYPMLDEELVMFSARIPSQMLLRRLELRSFFRRSLEDFLPRETLAKRKHGFGLPIGIWMAEHKPLREFAYDSLSHLKSRGYLKPEFIDNLLESHRSDHAAYYGVMIWVLQALELWLDAHRHR